MGWTLESTGEIKKYIDANPYLRMKNSNKLNLEIYKQGGQNSIKEVNTFSAISHFLIMEQVGCRS